MNTDQSTPPKPALAPGAPATGPGLLDHLSTAVLVLDRGRVVANGSHDELLATSEVYRRIFSHYDIDLPPLRSGAGTSTGATIGEAP